MSACSIVASRLPQFCLIVSVHLSFRVRLTMLLVSLALLLEPLHIGLELSEPHDHVPDRLFPRLVRVRHYNILYEGVAECISLVRVRPQSRDHSLLLAELLRHLREPLAQLGRVALAAVEKVADCVIVLVIREAVVCHELEVLEVGSESRQLDLALLLQEHTLLLVDGEFLKLHLLLRHLGSRSWYCSSAVWSISSTSSRAISSLCSMPLSSSIS